MEHHNIVCFSGFLSISGYLWTVIHSSGKEEWDIETVFALWSFAESRCWSVELQELKVRLAVEPEALPIEIFSRPKSKQGDCLIVKLIHEPELRPMHVEGLGECS